MNIWNNFWFFCKISKEKDNKGTSRPFRTLIMESLHRTKITPFNSSNISLFPIFYKFLWWDVLCFHNPWIIIKRRILCETYICDDYVLAWQIHFLFVVPHFGWTSVKGWLQYFWSDDVFEATSQRVQLSL